MAAPGSCIIKAWVVIDKTVLEMPPNNHAIAVCNQISRVRMHNYENMGTLCIWQPCHLANVKICEMLQRWFV